MGKWREMAEQLEGHDNSDVSANRSANGPNVTNVTNVNDLPPAIVTGLKRLKAMQAPRVRNTGAWRQAVSDALSLAHGGWAAKALALGWSPLDLFGAVIDPDGDPYADGLASWLNGRPVLAICETHASVGDRGGRAYFNRSNCAGELLLWEIGQ